MLGNVANLLSPARSDGLRDPEVEIKQDFKFFGEDLMAALPGLDGWLSSIEGKQDLEVCLFQHDSYTSAYYVPLEPWIIKMQAELNIAPVVTLHHDTAADWAGSSPNELRLVRQILEPYRYRGELPRTYFFTTDSLYGEIAHKRATRDLDAEKASEDICEHYQRKAELLEKQLVAARLQNSILWKRLNGVKRRNKRRSAK
jgi:hypothetical protein